ncbi:hypothetical protein [Epilithonimonas arachidiradicis]|uniref:Uncharacterized protein n=1 Tax=Epilithonimonas arachidiradicis TaxID=1617282 RepID=A0A420D9J5_9FLAO|nr:hypothetical protein [Epilithonimonas arachidiradicis]RKE87504.1 hypothetical protein BXY58_1619 [Epilithonimonas arachidiradicis]GGG55701.1 hypothetical protein GCM10007332_16720 [Epilithonimonas arachidiradicis]
MITKSQRNTILFLIPAALLSIPLIAMQFTKEVNWSLSDFVIGGILLFGTALTVKLILEKFKTTKSRLILIMITLAVLFLVWAELAVGIFGSPFAGS